MSKAYEVVRTFEKEVAEWAGAKYGVAVESCCSAIFLCLLYMNKNYLWVARIPKHTYPGVPMAVVNAGGKVEFTEERWEDYYFLQPMNIVDSALYFQKGMYQKGTFWCLSFHYKKNLPIGRGGMILTDDKDAMEWFKMARFDGRKEVPLEKDNAIITGWNFYMTPEQAARGLALFEAIKDKKISRLKVKDQNYPDLSKWSCFQ